MLSPEARAALQHHQQQQQKARAHTAASGVSLDEDFGLSQFWYTDAFAALMAREAITLGGLRSPSSSSPITVVCIACPSIYRQLHAAAAPGVTAYLLEYDARFAVFAPWFVQYDFHQPSAVPSHLRGSADFILADPPYLNADTLALTMQTVALLSKPGDSATRVIVNTGAVQRERLQRLRGLRAVREPPRHRVQIMNPFLCYASYDAQQLGGWDTED